MRKCQSPGGQEPNGWSWQPPICRAKEDLRGLGLGQPPGWSPKYRPADRWPRGIQHTVEGAGESCCRLSIPYGPFIGRIMFNLCPPKVTQYPRSRLMAVPLFLIISGAMGTNGPRAGGRGAPLGGALRALLLAPTLMAELIQLSVFTSISPVMAWVSAYDI